MEAQTTSDMKGIDVKERMKKLTDEAAKGSDDDPGNARLAALKHRVEKALVYAGVLQKDKSTQESKLVVDTTLPGVKERKRLIYPNIELKGGNSIELASKVHSTIQQVGDLHIQRIVFC